MGSKSSKPEAPRVTAVETGQEVLNAQQQFDLPAQQAAFQRFADPTSGIGAFTQLQEDVRKQVFGGEQQVREALQQNILKSLQSPAGATPEQLAAQESIRGRETDRLTRALRTRANLGGGLFGGRAQGTEERAVGELGQQFSSQDILLDEQRKQQSFTNALQFMQLLFPEIGIGATPFASPAASANTALQGGVQQRGQDVQFQQAQEANKAALQSALFGSLGTAAAGALTGGASLFGTAAKAGQNGFGALTPPGVRDMGNFSKLPR